MLDLDPRDYDSRDDERHSHTPSRGGRGSSGDHERDHDWFGVVAMDPAMHLSPVNGASGFQCAGSPC